MRICKINRSIKIFFDTLKISKFRTVIQSYRVDRQGNFKKFESTFRCLSHGIHCVVGGYRCGKHLALSVNLCHETTLVSGTANRITFPIAEPTLCVSFYGPFMDGVFRLDARTSLGTLILFLVFPSQMGLSLYPRKQTRSNRFVDRCMRNGISVLLAVMCDQFRRPILLQAFLDESK